MTKLPKQAAGLVALFYAMDVAAEALAAGRTSARLPAGPQFSSDHVRRAWELVWYFHGHSARIWKNNGRADTAARASVLYVALKTAEKPLPAWSLAEMMAPAKKGGCEGTWLKDNADLQPSVDLVVSHHYMREVPRPKGSGRPTVRYELNPRAVAVGVDGGTSGSRDTKPEEPINPNYSEFSPGKFDGENPLKTRGKRTRTGAKKELSELSGTSPATSKRKVFRNKPHRDLAGLDAEAARP